MAYPTTRPVKIRIDGIDRSDSISIAPDAIGSLGLSISDPIEGSSFCYFTVKNGGAMSLDERQEVTVKNLPEDMTYFGGYIIKLQARERGPFLDYDVDVEDYSFLLKNPERLISKTYNNKSDRAIIRDALNIGAPDITTAANVEELDSSISYIKFIDKTPWDVLQEIKLITGGMWYVDYDKDLHYFDSGTNSASYAISDTLADPPADPYPHYELEKIVETPEADRVVVQSRQGWSTVRFKATSQDTEQGNLAYENVGGVSDGFEDDGQDFSDWECTGGEFITDGTFETSDSEWNNGDLNNWTKDNAEDDKETGDPGAGSTSVKVTTSAANGGIYQGTIGVTAGNKYRLTFIYKNTAGDVAQFRVYDETNAADITAYTDLPDSTSWSATYTHKFTAPALCANVRIYLAGKGNGDIVYFDSVSLNEQADYLIVIENSELGSSWAYMGTAYGGNTKVYAYNDLYLSDHGFNGQWPASMTPTSYHVYPARGDKGYWITKKIVDNNLVTTQQCDDRGDQFLDTVADTSGYTCKVKEPGLRSGMDLSVTDARFSLSAESLLIKDVQTHWTTGAYLEAALELGIHTPAAGDLLTQGRNIWDESQFVPINPGELEMISGELDGQVKHVLETYNDQTGYPSKLIVRKSHTDTLETKVATIDTEELGYIEVDGVETGLDWQEAAYLKAVQDGAAGAGSVPAKWVIHPSLEDSSGNPFVVGPASSTDNAIVRWDGTGGDTIQDTPGITISDANLMTWVTDNIVLGPAAGIVYLQSSDPMVLGSAGDTMIGSGATIRFISSPLEIDVASGDPIIIFDTDGVDRWTVGVDDDDDNYYFKIDAGGSLGDYADFELSSGACLSLISAGPIFSLFAYSEGSPNQADINFYKSHDADLGDRTATVDGEDLGHIGFYGVTTGQNFNKAAYILAEQYGNAEASNVNGVLTVGAPTTIINEVSALALPVLTLDQACVDEPFLKFIGDAAEDDFTRDIISVADTDIDVRAGWIKIEIRDDGNRVADGDYYIRFYTSVGCAE